MKRRYVTADVFTDRMFGGNPLAVVLDAERLSTAEMQAIALEFNYSETTFVLPPDNAAHTAKVRIFTPRTEVPFAGHPNVGTAFALAREKRHAAAAAEGIFVFEETAGLVPLKLLTERGATVGAELRAPQALSRRTIVSREIAAACLSLDPRDIAMQVHAPQIVSVGLPFLVVELDTRDALRRSRPNLAAHAELLPLDGADAIFAYWRSHYEGSAEEAVLHARMFSPLDGIVEDPATGSACAAAIALLATLETGGRPELAWRIHQGVDMGRPSLLLGRTARRDGATIETRIGGRCVAMLEGTFVL
ncbi:MAG TPA: PhzF family phenazine biosynthesis protein [Steroidobacteraceae bacterium]|jgi:trans-2,3-dihydro-3-hydroxyanthranilate isomerase|nr:PhzF family phenazine biosynthesis protein [Steroidobacteraceae bacterium]